MPGSPIILWQRLRKARCPPTFLLYRPTSDLSTPFLTRPLKTAHLLCWPASPLAAWFDRLTTSGMGLTTSGMGLTTSGMGLTTSGMSLARPSVGRLAVRQAHGPERSRGTSGPF